MLKLVKLTSHGIQDFDVMRGESALRRTAQFALRSMAALDCNLFIPPI
jgi:hypothetical protein